MSSPNKSIGGYFELELPIERRQKYPQALQFQSARSAFFSLLQHMPNVKRVYAPAYICDSMLAPINASRKQLEHYEINEKLAIKEPIQLNTDDLLLYVNYFGVCDSNVDQVLQKYNPSQVVIDCSQAFYAGPYDCLATIYSPRKFFGVPDGGLLITKQCLSPPEEKDQGSISRMSHLIQRLAFSAEEGYSSYNVAEKSLDELKPKRMSDLTSLLLQSINYEDAENKRKSNFVALHMTLGRSNILSLDHVKGAPMCYPYLLERDIDKAFLANHRIYIPTYWPDVNKRGRKDSFEINAANNLIALPCDQRYEISDLNKVLKELDNALLS